MKKKGLLKKIGIAVVVIIVLAAVAGSCGKKDGSKSGSSNDRTTEQSSSAKPEEDKNSSASQKEEPKEESPASEEKKQDDTKTEEKTDEKTNETVVRPEFKEAMDSYEAFFDEYVEFMNSLKNDPTNAELLMQSSEMLEKEAKMLKEFGDWENDESMTTAEAAYYLEVHSRIYAKLAEVI